MAEWPVKVGGHNPENQEPNIAPGTTLWFVRTQRDGVVHSYLVLCPKCGQYGDCPAATPENPANSLDWRGQQARVWSCVEGENGLTMNPSILCGCGGHYWLTDGVLREV